jgi:hypothetical protein
MTDPQDADSVPPDTSRPAALAAWHDLVARRDPSGLSELLAADAVFLSPIVHRPQEGRDLVILYLTGAMHVLGNPSFRYVREVVGSHDAVLEFVTELDGVVVNGVDMLRWDDDGHITEVKVMVRPLKAITTVHERMAALLAATQA